MSTENGSDVCWACQNAKRLRGVQGLATWGISDCLCSNPATMYYDDYDDDDDETPNIEVYIAQHRFNRLARQEEYLTQRKVYADHLARLSSFGTEPYSKKIPNKGFLKNCAEGVRGMNFLTWNGNPATTAHKGETLDKMADEGYNFVNPAGENPHWGYQEGWYYIPGKSRYPLKKMKPTDRKWMRKIREMQKHKNTIPEKKLERIATACERGTTVNVGAKQCRGSSSRYPDDDNRRGRGWERDTRHRRRMKDLARREVRMWNRGDYADIDGSCSTIYERRH